jgi:hypothetical protein
MLYQSLRNEEANRLVVNGVNDVVANVFSIHDAFVMANYARENKLGGSSGRSALTPSN